MAFDNLLEKMLEPEDPTLSLDKCILSMILSPIYIPVQFSHSVMFIFATL